MLERTLLSFLYATALGLFISVIFFWPLVFSAVIFGEVMLCVALGAFLFGAACLLLFEILGGCYILGRELFPSQAKMFDKVIAEYREIHEVLDNLDTPGYFNKAARV